MVKQVIVMRKDLHMRKGKMIAQGAHASMKVLLDLCHGNTKEGERYGELWFDVNSFLYEWLKGSFTKVVVSVDSEQELLDIYYNASSSDIPCAMIEDNGYTEFKGIKTKTCCAIGPWESDEIDKITGHLKLL